MPVNEDNVNWCNLIYISFTDSYAHLDQLEDFIWITDNRV
jgi:hypothetical protein